MTAHIAPHYFVSQESGVVAYAHHTSPSSKHVLIQSHLKTKNTEVVCSIKDAVSFGSWRSFYENSIFADRLVDFPNKPMWFLNEIDFKYTIRIFSVEPRRGIRVLMLLIDLH